MCKIHQRDQNILSQTVTSSSFRWMEMVVTWCNCHFMGLAILWRKCLKGNTCSICKLSPLALKMLAGDKDDPWERCTSAWLGSAFDPCRALHQYESLSSHDLKVTYQRYIRLSVTTNHHVC